MMIKKSLLSAIAVIAVAFSFMIISCSKDSGVGSEQSSMFDNQEYMIAQVQPVNEVINDMTMSREMDVIDPTVATCNPEDNRLMQGQRMMPGRDIWTLGRILKQLNLTSDQIAQIRTFMQDHKDCIDAAYQTLRQSERLILQDANQKRAAILQDLKDSVISPEQAREQIRALALETRNKIVSNPDRAAAIAAIKNCRDTFFANIESILTADQLVTWHRLIAKIR